MKRSNENDEAKFIIYLAEDDEDDVDFFMSAISKLELNVEVVRFKHGADFIDAMEVSPGCLPDLIVLDINMPRVGGLTCLEYLNQHLEFKTIPAVVFSTSQNPLNISHAQLLGAAHYVVKPIDFEKLKEYVHYLVTKYRASGNDSNEQRQFLLM